MTTLFYLIIYDVPATKAGNKRRQRLYDLLCGYGKWTQFSVFECFLNRVQWAKLQQQIESIVKLDEDSLRIYILDANAVKKTVTYGGQTPQQENMIVI